MAFLDETGLAELWELIKAEDAKKAKISMGSYTGTGTAGSANPNSLTFDFEPKLVIVGGYNTANYTGTTLSGFSAAFFMAIWGKEVSLSADQHTKMTLSFSGNTMSWYNDGGSMGESQFNNEGSVYNYIAIG